MIESLVGSGYFGMDPEGIITYKGKPIPAHTLNLPPKDNPSNQSSGSLLRDGFAVEFNPDPDHCRTLLVGNFWDLVRSLKTGYLKRGMGLLLQSAVEIDLSLLKGAPHDVSNFGCEGAWNAYQERVVKPSIHGPTHPYRYTGGHMHGSIWSGYSVPWAKDMSTYFRIAKIFDRFPGLISTFITGSEWLGLRRRYYGQAGEFRVQKHRGTEAAIEYRTPGSEIMSHHALSNLMFGMFRHIIENYEWYSDRYDGKYEAQVRDVIDRGTSTDDMLDLIPPTVLYNEKVLRKARDYFSSRMHRNILGAHATRQLRDSMHEKGWREWAWRECAFAVDEDGEFSADGPGEHYDDNW